VEGESLLIGGESDQNGYLAKSKMYRKVLGVKEGNKLIRSTVTRVIKRHPKKRFTEEKEGLPFRPKYANGKKRVSVRRQKMSTGGPLRILNEPKPMHDHGKRGTKTLEVPLRQGAKGAEAMGPSRQPHKGGENMDSHLYERRKETLQTLGEE